MYAIEDPLESIGKQPPSKKEYKDYIYTKIVTYYEKKTQKRC